MKKTVLTFTTACLVLSAAAQSTQSVGIGTITPDASARLEVAAPNKGTLLTRVALTSLTDATTIVSPATSLLVYNTNTVLGTGYYYNAGTPAAPNWARLQTAQSSQAWNLTGNAGTNSSTNFLGTTDNHSLKFKVNNQLAGFIDSNSDFGGSVTYGVMAGNSSIGIAYPTYNTLIGQNVGTYNTVSGATFQGRNTGLGFNALRFITTSYENTGIGYLALSANTTGFHNTAIGSQAMANSSTYAGIGGYPGDAGEGNVALGWKTLYNNSGSFNVALGFWALGSNNNFNQIVSGSSNIAIGNMTLYNNTSGENNIGIGYHSGYFLTTGSNNVLIGYNAGTYFTTESNRLLISNYLGTLIDGDFSTGVVTLNSVLKLTPLNGAPANPAKGMIYFDNGTNKAYCYDGTTWQALF